MLDDIIDADSIASPNEARNRGKDALKRIALPEQTGAHAQLLDLMWRIDEFLEDPEVIPAQVMCIGLKDG